MTTENDNKKVESNGSEKQEKKEAEQKEKVEDKTQERFDDLTRKLSDKDKELKEEQFKSGFLESSIQYPYAKDFQDKIKQRFDSGMSVKEATLLTLAENKKLFTADEINSKKVSVENAGGSANTDVKEETQDKPKSSAESLAELKKIPQSELAEALRNTQIK